MIEAESHPTQLFGQAREVVPHITLHLNRRQRHSQREYPQPYRRGDPTDRTTIPSNIMGTRRNEHRFQNEAPTSHTTPTKTDHAPGLTPPVRRRPDSRLGDTHRLQRSSNFHGRNLLRGRVVKTVLQYGHRRSNPPEGAGWPQTWGSTHQSQAENISDHTCNLSRR